MSDAQLGGLRCSDVLDSAGSFVLGALSANEADKMRRHLSACPEAHAEIADLGSVVPALFETVAPMTPPAGLKARILAAAAAEQSIMTAARMAAPASAAIPVALPPRTVKPDPIADPQRGGGGFGSLFRRPVWAGLAAAAMVLAVGLGAWNAQLQSEVDSLSQYRGGVVEVLEEAARPGAQLAVLVSPNNAPGPSGMAAIGADGSVAMVMRELTPTTGTQVYTAWLIGSDGAAVPIGEFHVDDSRSASFTTAHPTLGSGVKVALSLEPQPGAKTPTTVVATGAASTAS